MDTKKLYTIHSHSLKLDFSNLENLAVQQSKVFLGTAGSVVVRSNAGGFEFYAHKYLDADRRQRESYVAGPVGSETADALAEALRAQIKETKDLVSTLRLLGREGYSLADAKTYSTLASLHNHQIFSAGGMLIGSHAYGVMLNRLGIRATPYATEDVDIARSGALAFKKIPTKSLLEMLRETGINFVAVPSLRKKDPPTSFKQLGKSRFHVDLLVPSADDNFATVAVPELKAHATSLPYLKYLLAESQTSILLAREGCCSVRIPLPERFAIHKLVVSQLRTGLGAKSAKDIDQALVLCTALANLYPGALEEAAKSASRRMKKYINRALKSIKPRMLTTSPQAWEEITGSEC